MVEVGADGVPVVVVEPTAIVDDAEVDSVEESEHAAMRHTTTPKITCNRGCTGPSLRDRVH
jgi:hypothetical protein